MTVSSFAVSLGASAALTSSAFSLLLSYFLEKLQVFLISSYGGKCLTVSSCNKSRSLAVSLTACYKSLAAITSYNNPA
jgi:hypothetical protein